MRTRARSAAGQWLRDSSRLHAPPAFDQHIVRPIRLFSCPMATPTFLQRETEGSERSGGLGVGIGLRKLDTDWITGQIMLEHTFFDLRTCLRVTVLTF
jgi:hypothetical protein